MVIIKGVSMNNYITLADALTTNFVECVYDREESDMVDIVLNPYAIVKYNHGILNIDLGGRLASLTNDEFIEMTIE